ncbi:MAG: transcriptional repressor NrdR [Planctomycetota bacterium]|nr:MAG: transcriptional repressor NrdR [Planctomycetota bacterium]
MRCPFCSADDDRVVDSRLTDDGTAIRRRRECNACGRRFTTYERVESEEQLRVIKRDGSIELFDRHKMLKGLLIACEKRKVDAEHLESIVNRLQQNLQAEGRREVSSQELGSMVMDDLRNLDQVAYVRFASVYREFKDLDDFMAELKSVIGDGHASDRAH